MRKGVNIAAAGIVSALGMGWDANLARLRSGASGLRTTAFGCCGAAAASNDELRTLTGAAGVGSRTALLGIAAAQEAMRGVPALAQQTLLVSSTTVGGMDVTPKFYAPFRQGKPSRLRHVAEHDCSQSTNAIARHASIGGAATTISTACSSGANAIMLGARLIESGMAKAVLAGGTDALCDYTVSGFRSLMILSDEPCRPLSDDRRGLNLGEGAAYVLLTADDVGAPSLGRLTGYANACDAFHQTAMSSGGNGATQSMSAALRRAALRPEDIDYVNLHGTATQNNDSSEGEALARVFGGKMPNLSSTKAFTGHALAAAGAIEAVFCLMALQGQMLWPNLNFTSGTLRPVLRPTAARVDNVLSNSLGFGGNCTSLVFSR